MCIYCFINILLIIRNCGSDAKNSSPIRRIVNGQAADIQDFPYIVSVQKITKGYHPIFYHYCGGIIISYDAVLSAAHCFRDAPKWQWVIRAGSTHIKEGFKSFSLDRILVHPYHNRETLDNDFAILFLERKLRFEDGISTINLAPKDLALSEHMAVTVIGWGKLKDDDEAVPSPTLQAAEVYIVNHNYCRETYRRFNEVTDTMVCASAVGSVPRDGCTGDSGGPLILGTLLVGVVSWGYSCAMPGHPGVYAKISSAHDWIAENVPNMEKGASFLD